MEPISLSIGAIAGVVLGAISTVGILGSTHFSHMIWQQTPPGTIEIDLAYTAHPEDLFELLSRDLETLNDEDRVELHLQVKKSQGWKQAEFYPWGTSFGPIHGTPREIIDTVRALVMDDDSPLTHRSRNARQSKRTHPEIFAWGKKSGVNNLRWIDSDSPLVFRIHGYVKSRRAAEAEDIEPELLAAKAEVDAITARASQHRANAGAVHKKLRA